MTKHKAKRKTKNHSGTVSEDLEDSSPPATPRVLGNAMDTLNCSNTGIMNQATCPAHPQQPSQMQYQQAMFPQQEISNCLKKLFQIKVEKLCSVS